jgi:hypothetical protein
MPTVFYLKGYRFFFFSNENDEPIHIHVEKAGGSAKYWLEPFEEVYSYGLKAKQRKEIRAIIELRINELKKAWHEHFQ